VKLNGTSLSTGMLTSWLSQISAAEEQMRAEGKIDKNGHSTNGKDKHQEKKA
jgi:hypothetical protein